MLTEERKKPARLSSSDQDSAGGRESVTFSTNDHTIDDEWDDFVKRYRGGHHLQSSFWAQVKRRQRWRAVRVRATKGNDIVGGAQMLYRPLGFAGAIGFVSKGPIVAMKHQDAASGLIDYMLDRAHRLRIKQIYMEPPLGMSWLEPKLKESGFAVTPFRLSAQTTTVVDLAQDADALLASMRQTTRRNVRIAIKKGVQVRPGGEADIALFAGLMRKTAERKGFVGDEEPLLRAMWSILEPGGHVHLLITEIDGEAVSAAWLIPFGDTVVFKRGAWSGRHGDRRPNEFMHWSAMLWAQQNRYRYYDFDGVYPDQFKLGFGGAVLNRSSTYVLSMGPLFGIVAKAIPRLFKLRNIQRFLKAGGAAHERRNSRSAKN